MLAKDLDSLEAIQTFCPEPGKVNLTSGTHEGSIIRCVTGGDVIFHWNTSDDPETLSMLTGDDYALKNVTVEISSGTFHISQGESQMFNSGFNFAKITFPPVLDKMIAWLGGDNVSATQKREYINSYHFTIQNCPPSPDWDCEYLAPANGEPGYTELLAIDDGTLYTGGVPNVLTRVILDALDNDQMFFCPVRGLYIYTEVLTGNELIAADAYCSRLWILAGGIWDDDGEWIDTEGWQDS